MVMFRYVTRYSAFPFHDEQQKIKYYQIPIFYDEQILWFDYLISLCISFSLHNSGAKTAADDNQVGAVIESDCRLHGAVCGEFASSLHTYPHDATQHSMLNLEVFGLMRNTMYCFSSFN